MAPETNPIVAAMIAGALARARELAREQARFAEQLRCDGVQLIVDDFADWLPAFDGARLEAASIDAKSMDDGSLVCVSPLRPEAFVIRVRNGRELFAGGCIVPVNDLAVLDRELYGDLVDRLFAWFGRGPGRRERGIWCR